MKGRKFALVALLAGCFSKPPAPVASRDAGGDDPDAGDELDASPTGANYMFVTSGSWLGSELADPAVADAKCQAAAAGKLPGTFKAWVSSEAGAAFVHARARLGSARGWIRPDGEAFADTVDSIAGGEIYYPPRIDESMQDLPNVEVYTGTDPTGVASGDNCGANGLATMGVSDATTDRWTKSRDGACGSTYHLYCFGIDRTVEVKPPPPPPGALFAFVSDEIGVISTPAWTSHCNSQASLNGMTGTFIAFVATTNGSARSQLPNNAVGWYRRDGVQLAANQNFLQFRAPLNVDARGAYVTGRAYSGAATVVQNATSASSCDNWSNTMSTSDHRTGIVERSNGTAFGGGASASCLVSSRLYCLQTQ